MNPHPEPAAVIQRRSIHPIRAAHQSDSRMTQQRARMRQRMQMVRPRPAHRHQRHTAAAQRQQRIFQLAKFVARHLRMQQIVALDPHLAAGKQGAGERLAGRWLVRKWHRVLTKREEKGDSSALPGCGVQLTAFAPAPSDR